MSQKTSLENWKDPEGVPMGTMNPEQKHDTLWNGYKQEERHQEK